MRSYDVPQERRGVLGDLVNDSVEANVQIDKRKIKARMNEIRSAFEEVKAARRQIVIAITERGDYRVARLQKAERRIAAAKISGLGKASKVANNEIRGMISEASARANKSLASETHITALLKALKAEHKREKAKLTTEVDASIVDGLDDAALDALRSFDKEASKLKFNGSKDYTVSRAPIIPVSKGFYDISTAKHAGLAVENIGGYMLVRNQLVIGLKGTEKGAKAVQAVEDIIESLAAVSSRKLHLVSEKGARYKGNLWFWAADNKTINALTKANRGGAAITDWGFGFTSE